MDLVEFSLNRTLDPLFGVAIRQEYIHTWRKEIGVYRWEIHYHKGDDLIGTNFHMTVYRYEKLPLAEIPWMNAKLSLFEEKFTELYPSIFELTSSSVKEKATSLKALFKEFREALSED